MEEETISLHKCPVCFELPLFEIYQCHAGHVLCAACYSKVLKEAVGSSPDQSNNVAKCPQCRVPYEPNRPIRNRAMELMLDNLNLNLTSFPCPHREFGCPILGRRAEIREHYKNCDFSNSVKLCELLGYDDCEYETDLSDVASSNTTTHHLTSTHDFKLIHLLHQNGEANIFLREWDKTTAPSVDICWTPVLLKLPGGPPGASTSAGGGSSSSSYALVYARTDKQEQILLVSCMLLQFGETGTNPLPPHIEANFNISSAVESLSWTVSSVDPISRQRKQLSEFPTVVLELESLRSSFIWANMLSLWVGVSQVGMMQVSSAEVKVQGPIPGAHLSPVRKGNDHPLTDFQCGGCRNWIFGMVPVKYKCLECPGGDDDSTSIICQKCMSNWSRDKCRRHRFAMLLNRGQEDRLVSLWKSIPSNFMQDPSSPSAEQYLSCSCDACGVEPVQPMMYKCLDCPGKTLCVSCVDKRRHHFLHIFVLIRYIPQVTID